ncbi:MAG TPA: hypothetical protein VGX48_23855 [Pyrinomonadaceae bacterium]|jgi:hypothetical protein|nr:hypothetical protein [Pyrinomonadaceae bacterium]
MRKTLLAVCALAALGLAVSAAEVISRVNHKSSFAAKTETRRMELQVREEDRLVRLSVKYTLTAGEMHFKLRDARGKVRQDAVLTGSGNYKLGTGELEAIPGVWTVEVSLRDATGNYEMALTAERP